ncbi:MAG: M1 family aminopeptidase [Acidobacteria bacterium]|nr:M1 family aminopeptidase [Acidobacteriota bacterium]
MRNPQDDGHYELDLTIPKKFSGIGVGEKILDEVNGRLRHIVYRTTNPTKSSTLYIGDYRAIKGIADDIEVELFQHRTNVAQRKNAKFMLTEITNALKVFNRMYVPLDIKHLRVTSTMTRHGRGFEGLILLGGRGTEVAESSGADLFRAHEVAHQWWGNYLRPKRWPEDRWLSEAFAEYSAMEYYKIRFDDPAATIDIMTKQWIRPLTEGTTHTTSLTGEKEVKRGGTVYPIAAGFSNVYTKGPMVLQMLRYLFDSTLQKDAFLPMLQDFLKTYRYKSASTDDFQAIAEQHLGSGLDWFFEQWIERGGIPILSWKYSLSQQEGSWVVRLQASQEKPQYRLLVPIYFHFPGKKVAIRPWLIQEETATRTLKLPAKPTKITLNDNLETLIILRPL